jgi:hypothetical protein
MAQPGELGVWAGRLPEEKVSYITELSRYKSFILNSLIHFAEQTKKRTLLILW